MQFRSIFLLAFLLSSSTSLAFIPPFVQGTPLPPAQVGQAYSAQVDIFTDSPNTLTVSIASGDFPPGLTMSNKGLISGIPTSAGDYTFDVRAVDANGQSTGTHRIRVAQAPFFPSSPVFFYAYVGVPVNFSIEFSNASPPLNVSILGGQLPPGLSLGPGGSIRGTPTLVGGYSARLSVSDATGRSYSYDQGIRVTDGPLRITSLSPPRARINTPYSFQLTASGGDGLGNTIFRQLDGSLPPGLSSNFQGLISGTPTSLGTFSTRWGAVDFSGESASVSLVFTVSLSAITLSGTPPPGRVGQAYDFTFPTSNANPPLTFSLLSGQLPPGLSLSSSNGRLSGTPTQRGAYSFSLRVRDSAGGEADASYTLNIASPALVWNTSSLPSGLAGQPYNTALSVSGGEPPYLFTLSSGQLPAGLTLSSAGLLSGLTTQVGNFSLGLRVQDAALNTAQTNLTLNILPVPLRFPAPRLPRGYVNLDYSYRFLTQGGIGQVRLTSLGALPPGLSLSPQGLLSGRPSTSGTYTLSLRASDEAQQRVDLLLTLSIEAELQRLSILDAAPPDFLLGHSPLFRFQAAAGAPPYRWSLAQGSLAAGLRLDPSSGQLLGRPLASGPFSFTLRLTDSAQNITESPFTFQVEIPEALPLAIAAQPYNHTLSSTEPVSYSLDTTFPGQFPSGLTLERNGRLQGTPTTPGRYTFGLVTLSPAGDYGSRTLTLLVDAAAPAAALPDLALPGASLGAPYRFALTAPPNPPAPLAWSLSAGALPPGLNLSADGILSGAPSQTGIYHFTLRAAPNLIRYFALPVLPADAPVLSAVLNAADYRAGFLVPLSLVTVFGLNIGPAQLSGAAFTNEGRLPTEVAGSRLLLDGQPVPLLYTSASQLSAVIPSFSTPIAQLALEHQLQQSAPLFLRLAPRQPAAFTQDGSGNGPLAALNQDGSLNSAARPARVGEILTFFLTGCGDTQSPALAGSAAPGALPLAASTRVSIANRSADLLYAGTAPGLLFGVCQINARVPAATPSGLQAIQFQIGVETSLPGARIFVE